MTTFLSKEFIKEGVTPIFEELKYMNYHTTRNKYAKRKNRKVVSLPYRKIQSFIQYNLAWGAILRITLTQGIRARPVQDAGVYPKQKDRFMNVKDTGIKQIDIS